MLDHWWELWQYTLVYLEEFFSSRSIKSEHLHRADLEALLQYHVDDLSSESLLDNVWFYHTAGTIIEGGSGTKSPREE